MTAASHPHPTLTLVMPTISWGETFATCLPAALTGLQAGDGALVVFDGTPPPTPDWLLHSRARVLSTGRRSGPAAARNLAAQQARGEILLFVDADVQVHPEAIDRVRAHFAADPELAALFGSYDDTPAAPGLVSRFRNLLHHHTHSSHPGPASSFWAGLGAVRRDRFLALRGFDAEAYRQPCIEDIEFGLRLHDAGGRILLDPAIEGTHHKRWTLALMLRTDILQRAIPWSRLLLNRRRLPATLNLSSSARLSAGLSLLMSGALAAAACSSALQTWALLLLAGCLGLFLQINRAFLGLLWRQGGLRLAAAGTALLILYLIYSSLCFVIIALTALINAPVQLPSCLQQRPGLQKTLAWAGLSMLGLLALWYTMRGLIFLGTTDGGWDLLQRFDEWRLFRNGIYPAGDLADPVARSLPYFRTTVYLPWALPLFGGFFFWGGFEQGKLVIGIASLASLAMMAVLGRHNLRPLGRQAGWLGFLTPLAINGNNYCLAAGQFSLICMGLISMQLWHLRSRRTVSASLCWALAMLKPQLALPFALPLLERRNRIILIMGIGLLLSLSGAALLHTHTNPLELAISWLKVLPSFQSQGNSNALAIAWPLLTDTRKLALAAILFIVLVTAILQAKQRLRSWKPKISTNESNACFIGDQLELAGLCGVIALLSFYNRLYDHIVLFPALLAFFRASMHQPRWGQLMLTMSMALSVWTPSRLLDAIPTITSIRALIWCLGGAWLLQRLLSRAGHGSEPSTAIGKRL